MDHFPRFQEGDEERKKRTKEQISHLEEIAGPNLSPMIAQKRPPALRRWARRTHAPHVLLDCPFADVNIQLQSFTPDALRPPKPIVLCHLLDQCNDLSRHLWFIRSRFCLVLPEKTKAQAVPSQKGRLPGRSRALVSRTASLLPEAPGGFDPSWRILVVCSVDEE